MYAAKSSMWTPLARFWDGSIRTSGKRTSPADIFRSSVGTVGDKSLSDSVVCRAMPPKTPPRAGFLITHFESIDIWYENPQIAYHRA
jgi:hypothetical protein